MKKVVWHLTVTKTYIADALSDEDAVLKAQERIRDDPPILDQERWMVTDKDFTERNFYTWPVNR